eukprot:14434206-Ditylum_brightwellii.AAC.1
MSVAQTSRLFNTAYVKAILTLSLDTAPAYVDPSGSGVLCPSRTHLALMMFHGTMFHPVGSLHVIFQDLK